jgi:hypothetical protein
MFFTFKKRINERISQSAGSVIYTVLYKALLHSNQLTHWFGNTGDVTEDLTTGLDFEKPSANNLREKGAQKVRNFFK